MPVLTLEAINENPRTVLSHDLPEYPSRLLLLAAQIAATCVRQIANEVIDEGRRLYADIELSLYPADYHRALEQWSNANRKIGEIIYLLDTLYDVPQVDFWFVRK